jgi:hypothetical protein
MSLELVRVDNAWYGVTVIALAALVAWSTSRRSHPTPPGPMKLPYVGSMLSMPTTRQWEVFRDWKDLYGECHPDTKRTNEFNG